MLWQAGITVVQRINSWVSDRERRFCITVTTFHIFPPYLSVQQKREQHIAAPSVVGLYFFFEAFLATEASTASFLVISARPIVATRPNAGSFLLM